jgi:phosphoribosylamine-glycine ligase
MCLKYPYYLNNPITLFTYPKEQQQTEHQLKQQTSQKEKKALTVVTITTGYPGKKSEEEVRKEQAPEPQKCQH